MSTWGIFNANGSMRTFRVGKKTEAVAHANKIMADLGITGLTVKKL